MINSAQLSDVMEYGIGIIMENRHRVRARGDLISRHIGPDIISP